MPKQGFGGDGDEEEPEETKKLGLEKFGLSPDFNIRDLFWKIMGSYAATKKPGVDLASLKNDRFALMRVGVSVLSNENVGYSGLSPRFISTYTVMMLLDGGWMDAFTEFLEAALQKRLNMTDYVVASLKKLLAHDDYKEKISGQLSKMLRSNDAIPVSLEYIAYMKSRDLSLALKKELIIFARGDIGENQHNAIKAISSIADDPDVIKSFIILLSHWDKEARLAAALVLKGVENKDVKDAAAKRLETETDEDIKKILKRIAK
jgi:hypothetical protein